MKLSFHGAEYDHTPVDVEVTEGQKGGTYRGAPWNVHEVKVQQRHRTKRTERVYRGVHYQR